MNHNPEIKSSSLFVISENSESLSMYFSMLVASLYFAVTNGYIFFINKYLFTNCSSLNIIIFYFFYALGAFLSTYFRRRLLEGLDSFILFFISYYFFLVISMLNIENYYFLLLISFFIGIIFCNCNWLVLSLFESSPLGCFLQLLSIQGRFINFFYDSVALAPLVLFLYLFLDDHFQIENLNLDPMRANSLKIVKTAMVEVLIWLLYEFSDIIISLYLINYLINLGFCFSMAIKIFICFISGKLFISYKQFPKTQPQFLLVFSFITILLLNFIQKKKFIFLISFFLGINLASKFLCIQLLKNKVSPTENPIMDLNSSLSIFNSQLNIFSLFLVRILMVFVQNKMINLLKIITIIKLIIIAMLIFIYSPKYYNKNENNLL